MPTSPARSAVEKLLEQEILRFLPYSQESTALEDDGGGYVQIWGGVSHYEAEECAPEFAVRLATALRDAGWSVVKLERVASTCRGYHHDLGEIHKERDCNWEHKPLYRITAGESP